MKKQLLILLLLSFKGFTQIGINTTTPNAMLDVTSATNGVLFPRIALTANNVAAPVVNPQGGALVTATVVYNTATVAGVNGVAPGYYYWNGSIWVTFSTSIDWKLNGNTAITSPAIPATYGTSTIAATENFIGTKDANDVVIGTNNLERLRINQSNGNVGIGTANPLAKLDVLSNGANAIYSKSLSGRGGYFEGFNQGIHSQGLMGIEALGFSTDLMVPSGANFSAWGSGLAGSKGYGLQSAAFSSETNYGGYFTATGGTNNYAIVVPSNGGNVGVGTITPTYKLHVTNSVSNAPTAYFENGSGFSGIGIEGISIGLTSGIGGKFTGGAIGVAGSGISTLGGSSAKGGVFSASSTATINYGITADASAGISANYAGYFTATGTTTNVAGYFSTANGATVYNNKAIIVPPNGGLVGIGTNNPVDQLEVAGGYVRSTGYRCRTGISGTYPGNVFNINWNGSSSQLWIDATNVGTFQFTSDRRLKENIFKMDDDALSRVMQLKPVSFNYKNIPNTIFIGSDVVTEGFIADELQEVIPSAVNGDKNAVTSDGTIQPQTINTAPIVSVLTKAIQEQQQIIDDLKSKNNQLEQRLKAIEDKLGK